MIKIRAFHEVTPHYTAIKAEEFCNQITEKGGRIVSVHSTSNERGNIIIVVHAEEFHSSLMWTLGKIIGGGTKIA